MTDIKPGKYRHFKGGEYEVIATATHSESMEKLVVYRPLYGEHGIWVRPVEMFHDMKTVEGALVPRFQYIGPMHP